MGPRLSPFVPPLLSAFCLAVVPAFSAEPVDWPGLRGPSHDGAVRTAVLFPEGEPGLEVLWKRPIGPGYPVPVTDGELVIAVFQSEGSDVVAAFAGESGEELWRYPVAEGHAGHTGSHDGPIATPALASGRVFALGPRGDLVALDATTGDLLWAKHLVDDLQAEPPYYGFASSPLVVDDVLVVEIGAGEGRTVAGFAVVDGELLWEAGDDSVRYQSPILWERDGRRQVVAVGNRTVSGLDPASGEVLWSHEHAGDERDMGGNTIVPIPAGEGRLLLLNRHPESVMLSVEADGGGYAVRELWTSGSLKSTYVQPVYHDGFLYGMNSKIFTAVDAESGEIAWRSRTPGDGFPTLVGDHLVIMAKDGTLRVAEANPEEYREVARLDLFADVAWAAPAYAAGDLWVRSMGELARIDPVARADAAAEASDSERPRRGAFARFLAEVEAAPTSQKGTVVDAFLAEQGSLPVIEEDGTIHFLYRGEAKDVGIVGDMIGFRREDPMTRIEGTDLFRYTTRLEPDAAVSYGFLVDYGEQAVPDPANPRSASGLFGDVSLLTMPARRPAFLVEDSEPDARGSLEDLEWDSRLLEGRTTKARVYLPAGYETGHRRYPVVYFPDGGRTLEEGRITDTLDRVLGDGVEPLVSVFVLMEREEDGPPPDRELWARMIVEELVPLVDSRFRTLAEPLDRAVAGAGGGGDMALQLAFSSPDAFGRAGALWPILFAPLEEIPPASDAPVVLHVTWGTYHIRSPHENFDAAVANRELWQRLREAGHRPAGGEVPEGLAGVIWRAHVGEMLRDLFPES